MTKQDILARQAASLANAQAIQTAKQQAFEGINETNGKLVVNVVPLSYAIIIDPAEGVPQEEFDLLVEKYGLLNA